MMSFPISPIFPVLALPIIHSFDMTAIDCYPYQAIELHQLPVKLNRLVLVPCKKRHVHCTQSYLLPALPSHLTMAVDEEAFESWLRKQSAEMQCMHESGENDGTARNRQLHAHGIAALPRIVNVKQFAF